MAAKENQWKVVWKGDVVIRHMEKTARTNLFAAGVFMKGRIIKQLTGSRSGRTYRVPGTQKFYVASAPGESPASRLGGLRTGIIMRSSADLQGAQVLVGPKFFKGGYPAVLEYGTRDSTIKPRPYMQPAFDKSKSEIETILKQGWQPQ